MPKRIEHIFANNDTELKFKGPRSFSETHTKFTLGDPVYKIKGSCWRGIVVGYYSTKLTPEGYIVESIKEPGSCQIYPGNALALMTD